MRTQYSIAPLAVVASLVGACGDRSALHEGPYQSQLVAGPGISPFTVPNTVALNPDTAIAVGPQDIVQMTNSAIQVFDRNLAIVDGGQGSSMDLATFIRSSDTNIPTDPRIVYDQVTSRFYYSALAEQSDWSTIFFGYSKPGQARDLSNGWCRKSSVNHYGPPPDLTNPQNPGYKMDYDGLGGNGGAMWIGMNIFISSATPTQDAGFSSATLIGVRKPFSDDCNNPYGSDGGSLNFDYFYGKRSLHGESGGISRR